MNQSYKKLLAYLFGLSTLGSTSFVAWEYGWLGMTIDYITSNETPVLTVEKSTNIEDLDWEDVPPKEPTSEEQRLEEEEEELRTSKMEESYYKRTQRQPPDEPRIGCICMDSEHQDNKGAGACSGHGGVRFWLYKNEAGEILEYPTQRHKDHPTKLTSKELTTLSHHNKNKIQYIAKTAEEQDQGFVPYVLVTLIICLTAVYIAKLKWGGHKE